MGDDARLMTLVRAIAQGDRGRVSEMLASAPDLALARLALGATIPGAPRWNPVAQRETVLCLVELGADPNAADQNGTTPLHRAVRNRCAAAVRALLDAGADPHADNGRGSTAVELARWTTGRPGSGSAEARAQQKEIIQLLDASGGR